MPSAVLGLGIRTRPTRPQSFVNRAWRRAGRSFPPTAKSRCCQCFDHLTEPENASYASYTMFWVTMLVGGMAWHLPRSSELHLVVFAALGGGGGRGVHPVPENVSKARVLALRLRAVAAGVQPAPWTRPFGPLTRPATGPLAVRQAGLKCRLCGGWGGFSTLSGLLH